MEHRLYRSFLEGVGGYRTVFFDNAKEAIAFARSTKPHLIHLDVRMAEYNGIDAARDLKGDPELADIPIVIVSATQWTFEDFKIDGRTAPTVDEILTKPIFGKAYIEVLRRLIGTADSETRQ
jgi:CheY-like chemotaxis protein